MKNIKTKLLTLIWITLFLWLFTSQVNANTDYICREMVYWESCNWQWLDRDTKTHSRTFIWNKKIWIEYSNFRTVCSSIEVSSINNGKGGILMIIRINMIFMKFVIQSKLIILHQLDQYHIQTQIGLLEM